MTLFPIYREQVRINDEGKKRLDLHPEGGVELRDHFAAHTHISWMDAYKHLEHMGEIEPTLERIAEFRAELRFLEANAMMEARGKY